MNIEAEVEKPSLYIMARYPSNEQQLLYVEEKMKSILNLIKDLALPSGIKIHDVFRFFKFDTFIFTPKYVPGRSNQQNSLVNSKL